MSDYPIRMLEYQLKNRKKSQTQRRRKFIVTNTKQNPKKDLKIWQESRKKQTNMQTKKERTKERKKERKKEMQ